MSEDSESEVEYEMDENKHYEDSSEYEESEPEPDFVPGINQYQHMGSANDLFDDIFEGIYDTNKRKFMSSLSGEQKFLKLVRDYMTKEFKGIDLKIIMHISNINQIKYKNPKAFVLACYFIESGNPDIKLKDTMEKFIEKETIKTLRCIECNKTVPYTVKGKKCHDEDMVLEVSGIMYEDVVRYIRLIRK